MDVSRRYFVGGAVAMVAGASASGVIAKPDNKIVWPNTTTPSEPAAPAVPAAPKLAERPPLLQAALAALDKHGSRVGNRQRIGVVDFTEHSSQKRFQIVDVAHGAILGSYLVAHGRGSDPRHTGWVERLSNRPGSNASCPGSFVIASRYYGKHGVSRRLMGLDPENNLALERAIVIHGASYVDRSLISAQGQIGRSLGCFAVAENEIAEVISELGEGCLLYASEARA
ncbi:murein L,D-transpeptidase catalytic domain family protein [Novosphingobium album (ex Hu et al. 2023)]|uniref:Murein L,D-transpeptidase catalytic domain family protein n=1 Tax=Novosphingobium album (ex Hu et al. 2023) TaxID=2930093 RepID=A0ABT0B6E3_9SPHN|nr:murein L,D-transpeptidase catalytic domain family protein [Novosphingobium album (ex Hu et al. 2023)]MCJ2180642.1 murein L,D-transpeptidase catalytic domain family protein [Novosphingobium album (ex Hu et al. 2023)]